MFQSNSPEMKVALLFSGAILLTVLTLAGIGLLSLAGN